MQFVLIARHSDGRTKVQYPTHDTRIVAESVAKYTLNNHGAGADIDCIEVWSCDRVDWESEDGRIVSPRYITTFYRNASLRR